LWFTNLTEEQRERLLDRLGEPLDPDLALELWRDSHSVWVVEPRCGWSGPTRQPGG
jgi:hypothetical protein